MVTTHTRHGLYYTDLHCPVVRAGASIYATVYPDDMPRMMKAVTPRISTW